MDESNLLVRRFLDAQGNGPARRAAQSRLLTGFERVLSPRSLVDGTADDLHAFLDGSIAEGFHPNTVRKWLVIARSFYAWLYRQGHISAETLLAIREIRPPAGSSMRVQPRPYSGTQLSVLRTTLDERWPRLAPDEARRLTLRWREGLYTGLRVGELQALDDIHVDLGANVIRVERAWDRQAGFVEAKSKAGRRTVPIPAILRPYLVARRLETGGSGLVFRTRHGNPFEPSNMRRDARRWWAKAGLAPINPHECRHTYASFMIAAGVNAKTLSTYMGHASITITMDRFGHLMPGNEAEAAALLDRYLSGEGQASG